MDLKRPDTVNQELGALTLDMNNLPPLPHMVVREFPTMLQDPITQHHQQNGIQPHHIDAVDHPNYQRRISASRYGSSKYGNRARKMSHTSHRSNHSTTSHIHRSGHVTRTQFNNDFSTNESNKLNGYANGNSHHHHSNHSIANISGGEMVNGNGFIRRDSEKFADPNFNQKTDNSYEQFMVQLGHVAYSKPDAEGDRKREVYDNPGLILDLEGELADRNSSPDPPQRPETAGSLDSSSSSRSYRDTLYFDDGLRKIDLMIVYEDDLDFTKAERRKTFIKNLVKEGLEIEMEVPDLVKRKNQDIRTNFVKVHAPWPVLTKYAEIMNMKMPIKEQVLYQKQRKKDRPTRETLDSGDNSWMRDALRLKLFDYNHERIPAEPSFFLASFSRQKEECFIIKDRETFFTPAQRSQIVWKILTRTRFDEGGVQDKPAVHQTGIRRLLNDKTITAAFPLHDGPYEEDDFNGEPNDRRLLYTEWAHFSNWYKKQPLWLIRRYFGDKVGLYFAWLGFYTAMLIPASIVGILCFLFGILTVGTDYNTPSREICDDNIGGKMIMCPLCGKCDLWQLQDSCTFSRLTYFFDNPATVFFAIFMAFWATSFLEFWKRKHAVISWEWDLHNFEIEEEPRPEFEAAVTTFRINPVTQTPEPYLSFWSKAARMLVVSSLVFLLLFIVAFVVVGIIIYRLVMMSLLYTPREGQTQDNTTTSDTRIEFFQDNAKIITSVTAAIINLVIVVFLHNRVYYNVAIWLTNSEYPRTQTEYEDSFTFKMFLFQFINYYSYLIYIAFFKGRFFRHPGDDSDNSFEKIRGDMCDPAGCLSELFIQLSIIMIGKQFFNNFMELLMPKMSNWCRRIKYSSSADPDAPKWLSRWELDYNLKKADQLALFQEYLEMVIQYGFVTLFVAAFPLAPFFALLNNVVEIRLDAYKWITQLRRPLAERVEDIGAWYGILQGITYTAVVTNVRYILCQAFVIAYTSDIIPRLVYKYTSDNGTLEGYINASLSIYPTHRYDYPNQKLFKNEPVALCRYRGYYTQPKGNESAPFEPTYRYYQIQAARLAFVAVFEHLAFACTGVMAFAIPDVPREISVQIQREKLLATEALYESDLARLKRESEAHTLSMESNNHTAHSQVRRGSRAAQDTILSHIHQSMAQEAQQNHHRNGGLNTPPNINMQLNTLHLD